MELVKLFVGLGNPGKEHLRHRHNIGFMVVDRFGKKHGLTFDRKQSKAKIAEGDVEGRRLVLAKPQTYMNLSGLSVQGLVNKYRLQPSEIMVVCDDMDLPAGKIRIRPGGGSGGHRGLQSIIDALGNRDFPRLRVGIGHPPTTMALNPAIDFVLTEFTREEREIIDEALDRASEALLCVLTEGLQAAMNEFNAG
ncbi:MAG: aminoacyl-tRNA hydrolase [Chloroflexi bacterium]|nr:aminoacyl-tRNA hydrolase [Chloroflexota bacterium]